MNDDKEIFINKAAEDMKRIAKEHNTDIMTRSLYARSNPKHSIPKIERRIAFAELIERAGLKVDTSTKPKTEDELGEEFLSVCNKLNGFPDSFNEFKRNTDIARNTYERQWRYCQMLWIRDSTHPPKVHYAATSPSISPSINFLFSSTFKINL